MLTVMTRQALLEATWRRYGEGRGCHRRACQSCGRVFFTNRPEARHCRDTCRQRAYRRRLRPRREKAVLAGGDGFDAAGAGERGAARRQPNGEPENACLQETSEEETQDGTGREVGT